MHEELEKLLNIALADGVLSDKEREILFRKAEKLGVDIDEFEMILEGRLSEIANKSQLVNSNQNVNPQQNTINAQTTIKCPNCGAEIPSFTISCNFCGHELRNQQANNTIQKLFELLNAVENERKDQSDEGFDTSNPLKAFGKTFTKAFSNAFNEEKINKKKMEVISSFPIPTSKEDLLEFLSLAIPKTKADWFSTGNREQELAKVWKQKCEQIIIKANFSFKNDKSAFDIIKKYADDLKIKI